MMASLMRRSYSNFTYYWFKMSDFLSIFAEANNNTPQNMKTRNLFTHFCIIAIASLFCTQAIAQGPFQYGKKDNDPIANLGILHTGDFYKSAAGVGLGVMLNIGRTTQILNAGIGVEYIEYISGDPRPDDQKSKLSIIGAGGQVVIPAYVKLQLFKTSKWTKFYVGCGCELGFKAYENKVLKDYYEFKEPFRKNSFAVVPLIGWRMRNVDFGIYYKYYTSVPFNHSLDGRKDLGKDKARIGYHLICYF